MALLTYSGALTASYTALYFYTYVRVHHFRQPPYRLYSIFPPPWRPPSCTTLFPSGCILFLRITSRPHQDGSLIYVRQAWLLLEASRPYEAMSRLIYGHPIAWYLLLHSTPALTGIIGRFVCARLGTPAFFFSRPEGLCLLVRFSFPGGELSRKRPRFRKRFWLVGCLAGLGLRL